MKRDGEMYRARCELLNTFIDLDMPPAKSLELIEPMENMSESEKEAFAKELRLKLQPTNKERWLIKQFISLEHF